MASVVFFAWFNVRTTADLYRMYDRSAKTKIVISGTVEELSYATDAGARMTVSLDTWDGKLVHSGFTRPKLSVLSRSGRMFYGDEGEKITCEVIPVPYSEIGDLTETRGDVIRRFSRNMIGEGHIAEDAICSNEGRTFCFRTLCKRIEKACTGKLMQNLPKEHAALLRGILFGEKADMSAELRTGFRKLGISHMLAVSGLHLSILLGGMELFLKRIGIHKRIRLLFTFLFLILFMGTAGFSPSIVRAGIMWMMFGLSYYLGGRRDSLTSLFFSALCICAVSPASVFDIGLILSVSATLGIILMAPVAERLSYKKLYPLKGIGPLLSFLFLDLSITMAATIFTLPVTLFVFGEYSLISPVANLILHPLLTGLLTLGPPYLLLSFLPFGFPAKIFALLLRAFSSMTIWIVDILSHLDGILIGVRYPFLLPVFLLFLIFSAFLLWKFRNILSLYLSYALCVLLFAVCMGVYSSMTADDITLTYQVQSRNDIIAVTAGGKSVLIDCSGGSKTAAKHGWALLSAQNHTELDLMMMTHYHKKHAVMLTYLSKLTEIGVLALPAPMTDTEQDCYDTIVELPCFQNTEIITYRRGDDLLSVGPAQIETLPYTVIPRSVQPLTGFLLTSNSENAVPVCLMCAAAWDPDVPAPVSLLRDSMTDRASCLLFGIHGPKAREIPVLTEANPDLQTVCAEALPGAEFCDFSMEHARYICITVSK